MAYSLDPTLPAAAELRRSVVEQIASAEARLAPDSLEADSVKAVHEARKALKRARSALRLGREAFGRRAARAEGAALRDIAATLSETRDADVMAALIENVADEGVGRLTESGWRELEQAIAGERGGRNGSASLTRHAEVAREDLAAVRARIEAWELERGGDRAVAAGVARVHDRGRRALSESVADPHAEARHELRKRVKDAWYVTQLLEPLWPTVLAATADEAHRLSDLLGDDHDLAVLAERIAAATVTVDVTPALELVEARRGALWEQAVPLAERLYAERPKALRRRLAAYRAASRSGSASSSAGTGSPTTLK